MSNRCEDCKHFGGKGFSNHYGECYYPIPVWLMSPAGTSRLMSKEQAGCPTFEPIAPLTAKDKT